MPVDCCDGVSCSGTRTVGAFIGVFTWHPILKLRMSWWFRSKVIGAWMNFVLMLFAYNDMKSIMVESFGANGVLSSPFWFVLKGGIIGLIIGYCARQFGGEGKEPVKERALDRGATV